MNNDTVQLPAQWSTFAPDVDRVFYVTYWVSVVMFIAVVGAALYLRKSPVPPLDDATPPTPPPSPPGAA